MSAVPIYRESQPTGINRLLTIRTRDSLVSRNAFMLQADIAGLQRRQKVLENEIFEALRHATVDDPMIIDLKSRVLFVREEIERLRDQAFHWSH